MKKLMNAVIGDPKTASPAKKYAAYALLGTAVAFVLALVILIVSSIAFAVADGKNPTATPSGDVGEELGGATVNKSAIIYDTSISSEDLDAMVDNTLVNVQEKRTPMSNSNEKYYDAWNGQQLMSSVQKALDKMLVDYYTAKQDNNIYIGAKGCGDSIYDSGMVVGIAKSDAERYLDATPIDSTNHSWIFENAYKYGFVQMSSTDAEQAHIFRYVGVAAATYMRNKAKNYSAFINDLKSNTKNNVPITINKVTYQMYYLAADGDLKVPTNYVFNVIADGTDGYIVTVDMSQKINAVTTESDGGVG